MPFLGGYVNFLEGTVKPQQKKNGNPISNRASRGLGGAEGHSLSVHWLPRGDLVRSKRGFEIVGAVKNQSPG